MLGTRESLTRKFSTTFVRDGRVTSTTCICDASSLLIVHSQRKIPVEIDDNLSNDDTGSDGQHTETTLCSCAKKFHRRGEVALSNAVLLRERRLRVRRHCCDIGAAAVPWDR